MNFKDINVQSITDRIICNQLNCVQEQSSRLYIGTHKYLAPNKVKFTMFGIQLKISKHSKKQENMTHNK